MTQRADIIKSKQTVRTNRSNTAGTAGVFYSFIFYSIPILEYQEKKDKLKISFCLLSALWSTCPADLMLWTWPLESPTDWGEKVNQAWGPILRTISGPGGASRKRGVRADCLEEVSPEQALKDGSDWADRAGEQDNSDGEEQRRLAGGKKSPPSLLPHSALPLTAPPQGLQLLPWGPSYTLAGRKLRNPATEQSWLSTCSQHLPPCWGLQEKPRTCPDCHHLYSQLGLRVPGWVPFLSQRLQTSCLQGIPPKLCSHPSSLPPATSLSLWTVLTPAVSPPLMPPQPPLALVYPV